MLQRTDGTLKRSDQAKPIAQVPPRPQANVLSTPHLKEPLPANSVQKAKLIFKNFTLSKFPKDAIPANYVPAGSNPAHVRTAQRKIIEHHFQRLSKMDAPNRGIKIAVPKDSIKKLLPSHNDKLGTIELSDLMKLLAKHARGTEFLCKGHPMLNRFALQARAKQIVRAAKGEQQ
jgi:hypothetical protein